MRRETDGLIRLASVQRLKRMVVVTKDEENVVEKDGYRIEILPFVEVVAGVLMARIGWTPCSKSSRIC